MRRAAAGFSLIDVLVVIVLLGIVSVTLVTVSTRQAGQSATLLKSRQMLAFAQGLLDEVRHMPFRTLDMSSGQPDGMGPEAGETRTGAAPNRFDGVNDYNGFAMPGNGCTGLCNARGDLVNTNTALAGCSARVTTTPQALPNVPAQDALRIVVTVRCSAREEITLHALRVREP